MSILVQGISKFYGSQQALHSVDFEVPAGQVLGFLGPNGAGKSTLMKILTAYLPADEGRAEVAGFDVASKPLEVKKRVGYLSENNPLYLEMYVREFLLFCAGAHKVERSRVEEVIEQTGLSPERHKKIGALSKGFRQRVGLAQALIHSPEVLILDEPTTGLDPNQMVGIRQLIRELGKERTVMLSTHILSEVELICDRVIILHQGRIAADQLIQHGARGLGSLFELSLDRSPEAGAWLKLDRLKAHRAKGDRVYELEFEEGFDPRSALFDWAVAQSVRILELKHSGGDLEALFRRLTN